MNRRDRETIDQFDGLLIHVELPYATFGLLVSDDGLIVDAPPMALWTLGRDQSFVARYYARQGAKFTKVIGHKERTVSDPPENPQVTLPHSSQEFDLRRLNRAMDAVLAAKSEGAGRYALVHTHGWPATDAVEYARAALHCIENGIDPNELGGT